MSHKISCVCGQNIPDKRNAASASCIANRFDYETEMLIIARRKGCRIELVPISTIYADEVSSIHPSATRSVSSN
jgi:hypothetical protein